MDKQSENATGSSVSINGLWRWATTPPQSYLVYVICLFLVTGLSYYAGTLKRRIMAPQTTSLPHQ